MQRLLYRWHDDAGDPHELRLVPVPGTAGTPFLFGRPPTVRPVEIGDFRVSHVPVTQALWTHVMGTHPFTSRHPRRPADNISWNDIAGSGGFLDRINASGILAELAGADRSLRFRLPSESEWEYAARGGPRWRDGFRFSGSDDIDAVAWYGRKWSGGATKWRLLKFLKHAGLWDAQRGLAPTHPHDVAAKAPNQLGLYDMSGNVWEWCQDACVMLEDVPGDGTPAPAPDAPGADRRLRGGCHHNWDIHCTVWWRYGIAPDAADGCIGFRLVLAGDLP